MSRREESQQHRGHGGENTGISTATAAERRARPGASLNGTQVGPAGDVDQWDLSLREQSGLLLGLDTRELGTVQTGVRVGL